MSRHDDELSALRRYLSDIGKHPTLTREQEMQITRVLGEGDDSEALHRLIESNLSFVIAVANDYRNMGLAFEDLVSEGNVGLIEAARRFDPARGTKFITYAVWWIRKAILKAISEQCGLVRVPKYQWRKVQRVRDVEAGLARALGRPPSREEVSSKLRESIQELDRILMIKPVEVPLYDTAGEDDSPIYARLVDPDSVNPEEDLLRSESEELLSSAVAALSRQEKDVISDRFGMRGRSRTLKEIGETMGVTRERIRQIEEQAKKKLRGAFRYLSTPLRKRLPKASMKRGN